ncbi:hypothetical protein ACFFSW_18340 [Saccharothrix longispora]|uniref:Excreted virulence factor EspC (Type VII ESX diderm) n=1 Tax=Saccharothrix longispora TaxID=33920 RepID=A0ABU1PS97_9PSEU|nr:hypothetical protein [Saccharothrix longispora]MDR6593456.1 hypothetical protein [Saccharothrix longispora]
MKLDWDKVDDANAYTGDTTAPPAGTYQGDVPDLDDRVPPPPRKTGDTGATVVSTDALRTFARNLRQLRELLEEALKTLRGVDIAPGAFYHATDLTTKLTGGLVPSVEEFLIKAIDALEMTARNLEQLAHDYDTTEELNGLTAVKLNEHIQDAVGYINQTTGITNPNLGGGGTDLGGPAPDDDADGDTGDEADDPDTKD